MFTRSVSPEQAPDKATYLEIDFEKGDPVALNGEKLSPATLLAQLNQVPSLGKSLKQPFGQRQCWIAFHCAVLAVCLNSRGFPGDYLQRVASVQPFM